MENLSSNDKDTILKAIKEHGLSVYHYLDESMKHDCDVILELIKKES